MRRRNASFFLAALERLLTRERRMIEGYHTLAELVKSAPTGLLLHWVITEEEAHFTLLCTIISSLKQISSKKGKWWGQSVGRGRLRPALD